VLGGRDKMAHAYEAETGKPLWTFTTRARVDSSPAIAGGRVFVGSNDGRVYGLDLASGRMQQNERPRFLD
jgi:outer membrane protein assembly factor BamB